MTIDGALIRQLRMHRYLCARIGQDIEYAELETAFQITRPTLRSDLKALLECAESAGAVVNHERQRKPARIGYRSTWLHPLEAPRQVWITTGEEQDLRGLLSGLPVDKKGMLETILDRIGVPIPEEFQSSPVKIFAPSTDIQDRQSFDAVRLAILKRETLQFKYRPLLGASDRNGRQRTCYPLKLWNSRGLWLVLSIDRERLAELRSLGRTAGWTGEGEEGAEQFAAAHERDLLGRSLRNFALREMEAISSLRGIRPLDLQGLDPEAFLGEGRLNLFRDATEDGLAIVRIRGELAGLAQAVPWHKAEKIVPGDGCVEISFPFSTKPALLQETARLLLEWGEGLEVVSPEELRSEVAKIATAIGLSNLPHGSED